MEMRRSDRKISTDAAWEILEHGEYGVLSTIGQDNLPYGVPLSYVIDDGKIYFHSAKEGRKIANLNFSAQVSFVVVGRTKPVYINDFSTYYESTIVAGHTVKIEDDDLKRKILHKLAAKYLPDYINFAPSSIEHSLKRTEVIAIEVESISGKAKRPKDETTHT